MFVGMREKVKIKNTLFPYQKRDMNNVVKAFDSNQRLLLQASTGYGKTYSFSYLAKWFANKYKKKVLILCHREELIEQCSNTLASIGLTFEKVLPSVRKYHHKSDVYVAMIETVNNRLKKNKFFLHDVGMIISDECHVMVFDKVYHFFEDAKILGVTATPVLNDRETFFRCGVCSNELPEVSECCGFETMEWSRPKTLYNIYQDIIVGASITELIEFGQLVKEINFVKNYANISELNVDSSGEFSKESQDKAFNNSESIFNVVKNYEEICLGKRTIIFNANSKVNKKVCDELKEKGYNAKLYDSVNETELSRKQLVRWFDENDDAILCNVGVFVAGFDNREVQAIILNTATTSLSRYLQMVGRGGRSSKKIYKDNFIVVDGGGNVDRFDPWSSDTRDWRKIFFEGIGGEKPKKETPMNVKECKSCFALFARSQSVCPECGHSEPKKIKEKQVDDSVLVPLESIPYPNGEKIYKYTISRGENINFSFKILINQIIDLFIFHRVDKELYLSTLANGKLEQKVSKMIRSCFFVLISKKDIQSGTNRTLKYIIKKTLKKLEEYYENKSR